MKFRAIILLKNREIKIKKLNKRKDTMKYGSGLYVVSRKRINPYSRDGVIKGSEIFFFEGDPNPLSLSQEEIDKDESVDYLDDLITKNALRQTAMGPAIDISSVVEALSWFKEPANLVYLLFLGAIVYGLIVGWLG